MKNNKIISFLLSIFILFSSIWTSFADTNINYNTCKLNNAYCNVAKPDIDINMKNKLDSILSRFYTKMWEKYDKLTDIRYIYYILLEKIKKIVSKWNLYDNQYSIVYYLYYNIESEYYKINHAIIENEKRRNKLEQEKIQKELQNLEGNNTYNNTKIVFSSQKNTFNDSFSKTKRYLEQSVYNGKLLPRKTIYCWCDFNSHKYIDSKNCWYVNDWRYKTRAKKIEWEHVVPAENFWRSFKEWRDWNPKCVDSKGKSFKWRSCAEKVNKEYRYMQADMYNLYPAIWALNALRQNYQMIEIPWEKRDFGKCDFEIEHYNVNWQKFSRVEPPKNMKWDIARVYEYMAKTYPTHLRLSEKLKKIFEVWKKIDPISKEECKRYEAIKRIQWNINIVLEESCNNIK